MNYRGIILTCLASNVNTPAVTLKWYKYDNRSGRELTTSNYTRMNDHAVAGLYFRNGFQSTDVGEYICSIDGPVMSETIPFTINMGDSRIILPVCRLRSDTSAVKIRVQGTLCNGWSASQKQIALSQFVHSLSSLLYVKCRSCGDSVMFDQEPTCIEEEERAYLLIFRGMVSSETAFCILRNAQLTGPAIAINNRLHFILRECTNCSSLVGASTLAGSAGAVGVVALIGTVTVVVIFVMLFVRAHRRYVHTAQFQ